jgi:hypothetical protein
MRGQLTRRCRILGKEHENDLAQCGTLLRQLPSQLAGEEQQSQHEKIDFLHFGGPYRL